MRRIILAFLIAGSMMMSTLSGCSLVNDNGPVDVTETKKEEPKDGDTETVVMDMTDPKNDEYGKLYYAPVDEAHIAGDDYVRYIDNEILIVAKDGVTEEQVRELAEKYNSEIVGEIEVSGDYQLRVGEVFSKEELENIVQKIQSEDIIDSASLNYVQDLSELNYERLNGFYYGDKWQDDLQDYNDIKGKSWGIEAINTMGAWETLRKPEFPVKIGIIDNGFDMNHDDLKFEKVFYDHGENGLTSTENDHGTHVAGIMAAKTTDTTGICGVYPYGEGYLYGVAYGGAGGSVQGYSENGNSSTSAMCMKIAYAELIVRNVKVINQSQGFNWYMYFKNSWVDFKKYNYDEVKKWWNNPKNYKDALEESQIYGDFLNRMLKKGYDFVIVSPAGNDSDSSIGHLDCRYASWNNLIRREDYPDVYDRIIVVGSVDDSLKIPDYCNGGDRIDIYAPGGTEFVQIYSTTSKNDYGYMFGTSMAAPHVAGVAAMVWSANNQLTGATIKKIIKNSLSTKCTSCNMVDAQKAVQSAYATGGTGCVAKPGNGIVMGYVVERFHEENRIKNATIKMTNMETGEIITVRDTKTGSQVYPKTDSYGHFEIVAPEGNYTLSVMAEGFENYEWPGGENHSTTIVVKDSEVNYLDWVKMRRPGKDIVQLSVFAMDIATMAPISNMEMEITFSEEDLECIDPKKTTGKDGSVIYDIKMGEKNRDVDSGVTLHIDGYKDYVLDSYRFGNDQVDMLLMFEALFEKEEKPASNGPYESIFFGNYEQDSNTENGNEPIEWLFLDENENGKLLISKYVLDAVPYNKKSADVTWETCSLRAWLNNDFINEAFTQDERLHITTVNIVNNDNEYTGTEGGNNTNDKIFCLSVEEMQRYFSCNEYKADLYMGWYQSLIAEPTEYAKTKKVDTNSITAEMFQKGYHNYSEDCIGVTGAFWWLRSPSKYGNDCACIVGTDGQAGANFCTEVSSKACGVRPVLYLKQTGDETDKNAGPYDAFMKNEAAAHFREASDDTQQFRFKNHLSDGKEYTLDDMIRLTTAGWSDITVGEPQFKLIDCGLDGVEELQVTISASTYMEDLTIDMIVKDIEGELWICYVGDSWSRAYTTVSYSGMINSGGSGGASSYSSESSFVDKNGTWKKWYSVYTEGEPGTVLYNGTSVSLEDLDLRSASLAKYTIGGNIYYCLKRKSSNEPYVSQSDLDEAKKRLEGMGMKIWSPEDIDDILTDSMAAIGLDYNVVNYKDSQ